MIPAKKKAFTLTELLVVVVVIGVLAAVVLPKFNKVVETRKTTEAEELMAAVRTEQERHCALDKQYVQDLSQLSDIIPNTDTKNFTYVATATGIKAHSKGKYGYTLQMPSYQDGRLCCDDADCAKLNKDYPSCSSLRSHVQHLYGRLGNGCLERCVRMQLQRGGPGQLSTLLQRLRHANPHRGLRYLYRRMGNRGLDRGMQMQHLSGTETRHHANL